MSSPDKPEHLYCLRCRTAKPATLEFWLPNEDFESGLHEPMCRDCCVRNNQVEGYRKIQIQQIKDSNDFDSFCKKALKDQFGRLMARTISTDKEI